MTTPNQIRVAVIGSRRGRSFIHRSESLCDQGIQLTAICDNNPHLLSEWKEHPGITLYSSYEQVLNDPNIDAVCIATPVALHARQAIAALECGKHVLSEVTAAFTLDECWDLVAAVKRSGLTYMLAENYCFREPVLQVQRMVEEGIFGQLTYASGAYIHDCRKLCFTPEGDLTWRGEVRRNLLANTYPTHSLGPVARWLGINRSDRLKSTSTWASPSAALRHYAGSHFPERTEYGQPGYLAHPDTVTTSINTEKGALIDIRVDFASGRPHNMTRHELQGTKASFCWPDGPGKPEPLIWIEGRSPQGAKGNPQWEPLSNYREEFMHPLWQAHRELAQKAGHGGGDYFLLREFAEAIREQRAPLIDVIDAVTWSCITPLSAESLAHGNKSVDVPNFDADRPE